jgi:excisionase family DNA binding protein
MAHVSTSLKPQLIKVAEAAELLRVSTSTIHNWIQAGSIPYIRLPGSGAGRRAEYRIPLRGLIASLSSNYDLARELDELASLAREQGVDADGAVALAGGETDPED